MKQWHKAFFSTGEPNAHQAKAELRELKDMNEQLQRYLRRKDRAMAKTAALLVLKKGLGAAGGREQMTFLAECPDRQKGDRCMPGQRVVMCPANQLREAERQAALELLNSDEFKDLPPSQIVPRLADRAKYVASESTVYRLLRRAGHMTHRRAERAPHKRSKPRALLLLAPF